MGVAEDVEKIARELSKSNSNKIKWLKALQHINLDQKILSKSQIGLIVNNLRSNSEDDDVVSLANSIICSWKRFAMKKVSKSLIEKDKVMEDIEEKMPNIVFSCGKRRLNEPPVSIITVVQNSATSADFVRLECQDLLIEALSVDSDDDMEDDSLTEDKFKTKALELEEAIYLLYKSDDDEYDDCVTTRTLQLKKNTFLRKCFITGALSAQQLARMPTKELANYNAKTLSSKLSQDEPIDMD